MRVSRCVDGLKGIGSCSCSSADGTCCCREGDRSCVSRPSDWGDKDPNLCWHNLLWFPATASFRLLPLLGFVTTTLSSSTDPSPNESTTAVVLPLPAIGNDGVSELEDCEAQASPSQSFCRPDTPGGSSVIYDTSCAEDRVNEGPCMLHSTGTVCTFMVLGECGSITP